MSLGDISTLLRGGVLQVLMLASPLLITALVVGLVVAILQATTSIQEQTLTFVPKIIAILLMLAFLGGWMFSSVRDYTIQLFQMIPDIAK
ncbi:flagellar biosynthetic protein FliQ [Spirochaetia bacterium]|nr:flagellar biosynthetic protein FliQ [Spirochaetia bacterium]GHU29516.1 flagellar biosynthetic protein FliQ [Spirochaetia bacterium]